jgi:NAD(P)-dependent dehydrogenase (short-subunit alcohol dehydrogenase family)
VIAVARSETALNDLARAVSGIHPEVADAGDPSVAGSLIDRYDPHSPVLVAEATPLHRPVQHHTWETFSTNWHTDVRSAFHWVREALLKALRPGSRVVVISSGAALGPGSPLSGGYAGAKATEGFIASYAQEDASRASLEITFTALYPRGPTPLTGLGRPAVEAHAARAGQTEEDYLTRFGTPLTPEIVGAAVVELLQTDPASVAPGYVVNSAGLKPLEPPAGPRKGSNRSNPATTTAVFRGHLFRWAGPTVNTLTDSPANQRAVLTFKPTPSGAVLEAL